MIIDSLENFDSLGHFEATSDLRHPFYIDKVSYFIKRHDLRALPAGKTVLVDGRLWLSVVETEGKDRTASLLETHDRYIDIHIPLTATETFGWQSRKKLERLRAPGYLADDDIAFYDDSPAFCFGLTPGNFVVFFPEDAHAPCIGEGAMKKIIVKIKA